MKILHHGAVNGVTGSCHELRVDERNAILIDCGLFQGAETAPEGAGPEALAIDFPVEPIRALRGDRRQRDVQRRAGGELSEGAAR